MILYLGWFFASVILCLTTLRASRSTQVFLMALFMLVLGVFVGLGDMLGGYDRYIYGEIFDSMTDYRLAGNNPWMSYAFAFYGTEFGYGTWEALMTYVTANRYIFIFASTIVIYILLIVSLRQYVENIPFAVIMFMGLWFFFTFTYLRQVMGCAICWLAVRYIIKRNLSLFLLVIFIGYSFHNSAIIFLPMYFLPVKKFPKTQVVTIMAIALLIGLTPIPQGLFSVYGEMNEARIGTMDYMKDAGFRWAYLIEAVFFLYVILSNYKKIENQRNEIVMLNMALIFCAILLLFVRSENGGRLGWLYMIGVLCTLSNICIYNKNIQLHGRLLIVICFFLFIRIFNAWQIGLQLYPYKTFLTDGYRDGDPIHAKYEYDPRYDNDKFYRPAFILFNK